MIRSNPIVSDPRVEKEVQSLASHGFRVTVLGWDREGIAEKSESSNHRITYRFRLHAPYQSLLIVAYYPLFWLWILSNLIKTRPRIIHACDLDSILPALFYKRLGNGAKVIFDVFDTYSLLIQDKSNALSSVVRSIELFAASKADALVTVSKERLQFFNEADLELTEIVMNCPSEDHPHSVDDHEENSKRIFRVVYAGVVGRDRGLAELADATKEMKNTEFVVAGRVLDIKVFDYLVRFPHVKYVGQLKFDESLKLERSADIIPVLYDPRVPINRTATPNKLFEAMMLRVPIITNLASILREVNCGICVSYGNVAEIRNAIQYLKKHPEARRKMGSRGRLAFEQKYNWSIMEKKLWKLYDKLLRTEKRL